MLAGARVVPSFRQGGISVNGNSVQPSLVGEIYERMVAAVNAVGSSLWGYNVALRDASIQTVLRAMYDEVKRRDDKKRDENFLS